MAELMMNIQWENVECHICHSKIPPEPITVYGKPLTDGQFGYAVHPVICQCGLVFLSPRWSRKDYAKFYENYYDELYRLEIKTDYGILGVVANMKDIWERIHQAVYGKVKNVLDVGCGSGYGLKYLKEQLPDISIFGIESSPDCCQALQREEIGATLITTDFDADWTDDYYNKMDLIIMRHVVEHMLEPVGTLEKLKTTLTENGLIYLATPDIMHPRIVLRDYERWWEYWFRPVHPYYYCKQTLFRTLELAGLFPLTYGDQGKEEVWCLATSDKTIPFDYKSVYREQLEVLKKHLPPHNNNKQ